MVPFDNTSGSATSMAIVNPGSGPQGVSVNIQTDDGAITSATLPDLPTFGQMAFVTAQQFPAISGRRGLAEFYTPSGSPISIAAFAFDSTNAFASSPVFPQIGPPIIGSPQTSAPPSIITMTLTFTPAGASPTPVQMRVTPNSDGTYAVFVFGGVVQTATSDTPLSFSFFEGSAINGSTTFGFTELAQGSFRAWLSGSLLFTLTPKVTQANTSTGSVTGVLSLVALPTSGGVIATGAISGTFTETF